jgi:serine/threonine protein kinase
MRLPVIIKCFPRSVITTDEIATRFTCEINLVQQMDHPFIAKLFDVVEDRHCYFLIFEFIEHGSLTTFITTHGPMPEPQARRCFSELMHALSYLHNVSCIPHRDLRPGHVMFDGHAHIRLIDFGFSAMFGARAHLSRYSPPEVLTGDRYTIASDIWNAGILLSVMISGELPPESPSLKDLCEQVVHPHVPIPLAMSPLAADLARRLLRQQPDERLPLAQILKHDWFAELAPVPSMPPSAARRREIAEALGALGYEVDQSDFAMVMQNPELNVVYQIVERRVLAEHAQSATRECRREARVKQRIASPMTPPPRGAQTAGARRQAGQPVQVPRVPPAQPKHASAQRQPITVIMGGLPHAVTAPPVHPAARQRRAFRACK